jgi:hypothetical protein
MDRRRDFQQDGVESMTCERRPAGISIIEVIVAVGIVRRRIAKAIPPLQIAS